MTFQIKRIYEPASPDDGLRVLADRLWPRGLKKESAVLTSWMKEVAPSNELRTWFDHRPRALCRVRAAVSQGARGQCHAWRAETVGSARCSHTAMVLMIRRSITLQFSSRYSERAHAARVQRRGWQA